MAQLAPEGLQPLRRRRLGGVHREPIGRDFVTIKSERTLPGRSRYTSLHEGDRHIHAAPQPKLRRCFKQSVL
jgi:hypothetical protein